MPKDKENIPVASKRFLLPDVLPEDFATGRTVFHEASDSFTDPKPRPASKGRRRSLRRSFSAVDDWKLLPLVCQGSLLFYASDNFYYNKWLQADFLSTLLVQGSKGDSDDTIMLKALIMTSADLAAAMQEVKHRAVKVLLESIKKFLKNRRDRQQRELDKNLAVQHALGQRPPKPWNTITLPPALHVERKKIISSKAMWRAAANRITIAKHISSTIPKNKYRASAIVEAAASGNAKLLLELLHRRSVANDAKNPVRATLFRSASKQMMASMKRITSPITEFERASGPELNLELWIYEDLNVQDTTRKTALQAAVENKKWDCVALLLKEPDIIISVPDQQTGDSIVHTLVGMKGFPTLIELLKTFLSSKFSFDVNMKNRQGATILAIAVSNNFLFEDELHTAASISLQPMRKHSTGHSKQAHPDISSVKKGIDGIEVLKTIISHKGDVNATDNMMRFPIEHAAAAGILEYVMLLAEQPNLNPDAYNRALFAAVSREFKANMDIIRYLICEKQANVRQEGGKQDNLLIVASRHNQLDCVRTLLSWPFIPRDLLKARNADCFTALHAAVHENNNEIALMLVKHIFGHSVLDDRSELGLQRGERSSSRDSEPGDDEQEVDSPGPRRNRKHTHGRRGALIVASSSTDPEVVDAFLFSVAAQAKNVEMIEHLLFEGKSFKDTPIQVMDRAIGTLSTNLLCWSVRQKNKRLLNLLLNFGADINAIEIEGSGLFPLMIVVRNLASPPWSRLAMEVLQVGKDTPCITMADMVNIIKRTKWEICNIADALQDSKGNPLKSPTGRQLFSRNSWKFSWYGFQAVCSEVSQDIKARVETYTNELDTSLLMYETIINSPQINIHQEVSGQTTTALAVECGNWRVYEDLRKFGAQISHPSVIQACAVNSCSQRLVECLEEELSTQTLTESSLRKIFDMTCEAGHVECAQLLFEHSKARNLYLSVQEQLLKAATDKQHWMIDFLLSKDRSYATKGKALVICAVNGDFRSLSKLIAHGADPDFRRELFRDPHEQIKDDDAVSHSRPLCIAAEYWGRSGSSDHYEVLVCLLSSDPDVTEPDSTGKTILMWACLRGHVTLAEMVLAALHRKCNANQDEIQKYLNAQDHDGRTAIMHSILSPSESCVELLLSWKSDVDVRSYEGKDGIPALTVVGCLTSRCRENAPRYLMELVARSKSLDAKDENGSRFVEWAARYNHTQAVRLALELNTPDSLGIHDFEEGRHSALEIACMCRRREICGMFISTWDLSTSVPDSIRSGSFIGLALFARFIEYGWEDVTLQLIERFCPFDVKSQVVVDALQSCVQNGWLRCIKALLDRKVSPNSFSSSGHSPLVLASQLNHIGTVKCLLENNASGLEAAAIVAIHLNHLDCFEVLFKNIKQTFDFIRTAACIASLENNVQALKLILAHHSSDNQIHLLGQKLGFMVAKWIPLRNLNKLEPSLYQAIISDNLAIPLLCAVAKGSLACSTFLLDTGADALATDENGVSAMVWACAVGNLEIVKGLLKHGASILGPEKIMPFSEMKLVYNLTVIQKIEGRMKKLLRRTLHSPIPDEFELLSISVPPLLVALLKGHTDVVRLLLEAGASTGEILEWCNHTLADEVMMEPFLRSILEMLVLYEDYKTYGPFGSSGYTINISDTGKIPDEGRVYAVIAQFSKSDWSLEAVQFVYEANDKLCEAEVHAINRPFVGDFRHLHPYAHLERLDLEPHEYIIQAELAIANTHIHSLRFTTNLRVAKWLGSQPLVPRHRIVTVCPVGREIVGLFSCVLDRYYLIGFLTRLKMGDFRWRTFRGAMKAMNICLKI